MSGIGTSGLGVRASTLAAKEVPFNIPGLPLWSAAVRAQQEGERNARFLCIGDSTTAGAGANGAQYGNNAKSKSWPTVLGELLAAQNYNVGQASMISSNNMSITTNNYDSRLSFGAGWAILNPFDSSTIGGQFLSATSSGKLTFAPAEKIDTVEVAHATNPAHGTINVSFDGGATVQAISCQGPVGIAKTLVPVVQGIHSISLARSVANVSPAWIYAYDSAHKEISILNGGWAASKVADWTVTTYAFNALFALSLMKPDIAIICLTINDANAGTNHTAYRADLGTLIDRCKNEGSDVLCMSGAPSDPNAGGNASYAVQQSYVDDMSEVALAKGLPDIVNVWADVFGGIYQPSLMFDNKHPNATGYNLIANKLFSRVA